MTNTNQKVLTHNIIHNGHKQVKQPVDYNKYGSC